MQYVHLASYNLHSLLTAHYAKQEKENEKQSQFNIHGKCGAYLWKENQSSLEQWTFSEQ